MADADVARTETVGAETPLPSAVDRAAFNKLWLGQSVSLFGSEVTSLAMPLVAVLTLGASPAEMGILRAVQYAPWLLSLPVGVVVDRVRRRPLLIGTDLGQAVLLASVPAAVALHVLCVPQLYVVALVTGALAMVFSVAYYSYLPGLVATSGLLDGNRRLELSRTTAHAVGPAIGGALVQALSAPLALLVDSATFVFAAVCVTLIGKPEQPPPARAHQDWWREVLDGLRYLAGHPVLRATTLASAAWNFFSGGLFDALYVLYLARELHLEPVQIAAIVTSAGVAGMLGALASGRITRRLGLGPSLIVGFAIPACSIPFVLVVGGFPLPLMLLVLAGVAAANGFWMPVVGVSGTTIALSITPSHLVGRMIASRSFIQIGVVPVDALLGGALGDLSAPRPP